jgi:prolyl-tRNA synthetase
VLGHGDQKGLVLPPKIAPIQVVIVPIYKTEEEKTTVLAKCNQIAAELKAVARVHLDLRDNLTPGFKFNYWEQKGVPVRLNIGPKDVANNVVEIARRDTGEKIRGVSQLSLNNEVAGLLDAIQKNIYDKALAFRKANTATVSDYAEFQKVIADKGGFVEVYWDGSNEDEGKIKEQTKATVRCIPFVQEAAEGKCMYTGRPTSRKVIFAKAY